MVIKPILYLLLLVLVLAILAAWIGAGVGLFAGGDFLRHFLTSTPWLNYAFVLQVFFLISIPILLIVLSLYGLLRNRASSIKPLKNKLDYIWVTNLLLLFVWIPFIGSDAFEGHNHLTSDVLETSTEPMMLKINSPDESDALLKINTGQFKFYDDNFYQFASLSIRQSQDDKVQVDRRQWARGRDIASAKMRINSMSYLFSVDNKKIEIADYFDIGEDAVWRGQFLHYEISLPLGQKIQIEDVDNFSSFNYKMAESGISPDRYVNKTWEMTQQGLKCLDCNSI